MTNKIAFCGIAGAGKDYFVKVLEKKYNFHRFAFADGTKEVCSSIFNWLEKDYPPEVKENKLTVTTEYETLTFKPRDVWIDVSAVLRKYENYIFIRKLREKLNMVNINNIVISDLRTKEEFEFLRNEGFTIINIEPSVIKYEPNNYDEQIKEFKAKVDYNFINNFNGEDEFIEFFETILKDKNEQAA